MKTILGIETSCDETAAAVVVEGREVRSNVVSSQVAKHAVYGGVVPELAAREHLISIEPVVAQALDDANVALKDIDAIAVTNGPGLIPSLLIGVNFARGLAAANKKPLIGINHFLAHIYGAFLGDPLDELKHPDSYPVIALVVSGGHTALVHIEKNGESKIVGTTLDDAAGEAFDKVAKLLNLGYPGGPVIEKISQEGNSAKFAFPRSLTGGTGKAVDRKDLFNFSFSGVKTSIYYHCKKLGGGDKIEGQLLFDTAASFQEAVVDVLSVKTFSAAEYFNAGSIVLCGGVACNKALRERFTALKPRKKKLFIAPPKFCTDNAAMIAGLAFHHLNKKQDNGLGIDVYSRNSSDKEFRFITFS